MATRIHIDFKRRLLAYALSGVVYLFALGRKFSAASIGERKKLILIEPYGLGDWIHLQPLVNRLLAEGFELTLIAPVRWKPLFPAAHLRWLDSGSSWDRLFRWPLGPLFRKISELKEFFRAETDPWIGLDPRGDVRSILILRLLGAQEIVSLDHYAGTDLKLPKGIARLVPDTTPSQPRWKANLGLLAGLDLPISESQPPRIQPPPASRVIPGRVGIVPIAPWPGRLWSSEKWQELIVKLEQNELRVIPICGPGQMGETGQQIRSFAGSVIECKNIEEMASELSQCEVVVSLDSGPLHLASALNRPVVGLYGPGQLPAWAPPTEPHRILSHQSEFPSGPLHQISKNIPIAQGMMNRISVDEVLNAILSILSKVGAPRLNG